ncbi:hypothetical protein FA15DRAFT_671338 [Coprinopsis marcescibilis]|uniref:CFEM domain-containing protein n=1 Tax=Coprinopsis marcescibilis TaxID=230819 RepID=A0A5C3KQ41_COPMA|nr:hypothetical protein FA15DRAFT_671338 [Coprinopsis marcescibilis]
MAKLSLFNCVLLAGLALSQLAAAQFTNLPQCGQDCTSAAATANDCGANDSNCACNKPEFVDVASQCIASECPAAERNTAYYRFMDTCDAARASPSPTPSAAPSPSPSPSPSPPASNSASPSDTADDAPDAPAATQEETDDASPTPTRANPAPQATRANIAQPDDDDARPTPTANASRPARSTASRISTQVVVQTVAPGDAETFFTSGASPVGMGRLVGTVIASIATLGVAAGVF